MRQTVRRALCLILCLLLALCAAGCALFPESVPEFSGDTAELSVGSPYKHYFAALSDTEKAAYNAILSKASAFPQRIEIPSLTRDELDHMYSALLFDNPELARSPRRSQMKPPQKKRRSIASASFTTG